MAEPYDTLSLFRTWLEGALGVTYSVRFDGPQEDLDDAKTWLIAEVLSAKEKPWIGNRHPTDSAKRIETLEYTIRVEAWQSTNALAWDKISTAREAVSREAGWLSMLKDTGLKLLDVSDVKGVPFDPNLPKWRRASFTFTADKDKEYTP